MMKSAFLFLCAMCLGGVSSQSPVGFLHDRVDIEYIGGIPFFTCVGETLPIPHHLPELSSIGWEGRAVGIGDTVGPWIYYSDSHYNGNEWTAYHFSPHTGLCTSFVDTPLGSVRSVGPPEDWQKDSITVYEGVFFDGIAEEMYTTHQPSISLSVKSLILTGSSPWTLFTGENYTGQSVCVIPDHFTYPTPYIDTLHLDPPMEHGSIRSIRRGCLFPSEGKTSSLPTVR